MERDHRKIHRPNKLGLLMAKLPKTKFFYPLYRAAELYRTENTFYFSNLPNELDGIRIVFAADMHYGAYLGRDRIEDLVRRMNAEKGELILLGGDYGEDTRTSVSLWRDIAPRFRTKYGAYAVEGNHDLTDPDARDELDEAIRQSNVTLLTNQVITLDINGAKLTLAGVDDINTGEPAEDLMEKECAGKGFTVLLSHSPDVLPSYFEKREKAHFDLFLCGHTHGGQLAIGGKAIRSSSRYGNRYNQGEKTEKGAQLLITMGVGTSMFPIRLGTKPEYHVITLRKK